MKNIYLIICFIATPIITLAQNHEKTDLTTVEGTVKALLDHITIEKGEKMDTAAVRSLFHPAAILTVTDSSNAETVSLDDFLIIFKDPYHEQGYLEREIHKNIDEYNGIAQVFQSFYGKDSESIEERGINSYQLTYYKGRWWIVSLLWTIEPDNLKIPAKYEKG